MRRRIPFLALVVVLMSATAWAQTPERHPDGPILIAKICLGGGTVSNAVPVQGQTALWRMAGNCAETAPTSPQCTTDDPPCFPECRAVLNYFNEDTGKWQQAEMDSEEWREWHGPGGGKQITWTNTGGIQGPNPFVGLTSEIQFGPDVQMSCPQTYPRPASTVCATNSPPSGAPITVCADFQFSCGCVPALQHPHSN